jgi:L-iditol 2-dehydrogenase
MANNAGAGNSVVYYAPGDVRIEEMKPIESTGDGEVTIKVEACAICGTDIKSYLKGNPRIKPPMIMGHEFCGEIIEVGSNANGYKVGQRVTMATTIGCADCIYCNQGRTNLCRSAEAIGFHYPGAMAAYVKIPAKAVRQGHLVDVGELDSDLAALGEPLSCVVNGLGRVPIEKIGSALVLGLGPLGMLHAVTLRQKGVEDVSCVEFPGRRAQMAREMGFTVVDPANIDNACLDLSQGEGFDLVVITAPSNQVQSNAMKYAKKGGYVSYFASLPVGDEFININSRTLHYNELIAYGTSDSTAEHVKEAVSMLRKNPDAYRPLVTHKLSMTEFHKAMDIIKEGSAVKVVLVP